MRRLTRSATIAAMAALGILAFGGQSRADGVKTGVLTCSVASGWGFVIGSTRDLNCVYSPLAGPPEHYAGTVSKFGVDIGYQSNAVIVWGVIAPTAQLSPGALAGTYGGVTGSAAAGVGAGANVLVGGSNQTISLQPVSVEGDTGLNVAGGIGEISLSPAP